MKTRLCLLTVVLAAGVFAQEVKMPANLDRLAKVAKESVDVNLNPEMLQLGVGFLSDSKQDEAQVKKLVSKLKGIYVRTFEFAKPGMYSKADVESVRSQLSGWEKMVSVESKDDNTWVYVKKRGDQMQGMFVIAAEPTELSFVNIEGQLDPKDLSQLSGQMGIPSLSLMHTPAATKGGAGAAQSSSKEDQDEDEPQL
jgi:hypothetical protein